jgi:hypothetical protein
MVGEYQFTRNSVIERKLPLEKSEMYLFGNKIITFYSLAQKLQGLSINDPKICRYNTTRKKA